MFKKNLIIGITITIAALTLAGTALSNQALAGITCVNTPACLNNGGLSRQDITCVDVSKSCANTGVLSTQSITCGRVTQCENFGTEGSQSITCARVSSCLNLGDKSTQNLNCANAGASCQSQSGLQQNTDFDIAQNTNCQNSGCNTFTQALTNRQTTNCNSVGSCTNFGDHTTVNGVGVDKCAAGATHTTTVCQPGRTTVITP